jgi:hypothetical protein
MANALSNRLVDALDRQESVSVCLAAVVDLMARDAIDDRARERVAMLLSFVQKEYAAACEAARQAIACDLTHPPQHQ